MRKPVSVIQAIMIVLTFYVLIALFALIAVFINEHRTGVLRIPYVDTVEEWCVIVLSLIAITVGVVVYFVLPRVEQSENERDEKAEKRHSAKDEIKRAYEDKTPFWQDLQPYTFWGFTVIPGIFKIIRNKNIKAKNRKIAMKKTGKVVTKRSSGRKKNRKRKGRR